MCYLRGCDVVKDVRRIGRIQIEMLAIFAATQQHSEDIPSATLSYTFNWIGYTFVNVSYALSADLFLIFLSKPPRLPVRAVLVSFTLSPVLLRDWKVRTGTESHRIAVISSAIAAFTSIVNSITSSQREDVRSVAVLLVRQISCDEKFQLIFFAYRFAKR
jgi:hypothetical protein